MLIAAVFLPHHKGVRSHVNLLSVFDIPCWEQFQVTNGQAGTVSLRHTNVSWLGLIAVDCSMWSCETAGLWASKASPMSSLSLILSPCSPIIPCSSDWSGHRVTCLSPSELPRSHKIPSPQKCCTNYKHVSGEQGRFRNSECVCRAWIWAKSILLVPLIFALLCFHTPHN